MEDSRVSEIPKRIEAINKDIGIVIKLCSNGNTDGLIVAVEQLAKHQRYLLTLIKMHGDKKDTFALPSSGNTLNTILDILDEVSDLEMRVRVCISSSLKLPTFDPNTVASRKSGTTKDVPHTTKPKSLDWEADESLRYEQTHIPRVTDLTPALRSDLQEFSPTQIGQMRAKPVRLLGKGCFGKVFESIYNGIPVAVKLLNTPREAELISEIRALKSSPGHPHILQYIGCCTKRTKETEGKLVLVTEVLTTNDDHTNLEELIHDPKVHLSEFQRIRFAKHAALGIVWLHHAYDPPILHRDLATKNLFVSQNDIGKYVIKVGDFGLATKISRQGFNRDADRRARPPGTALTMAPEVMHHHRFNTKADVYSFAMILWELWTCQELETDQLYDMLDLDTFASDFDAFVDLVRSGFRPGIPHNMPRRLQRLIKKCWDYSPNERPDMRAVLSEIEQLLVELAIHDPSGIKFWKTYFLGKEVIPWDTFKATFYQFLRAPLPGEENHSLTDQYVFMTAAEAIRNRNKKPKLAERAQPEVSKVLYNNGNKATWAEESKAPQKKGGVDASSTSGHIPKGEVEPELLKSAPHKMGAEFFVDIEQFGEFLDWYGPIKLAGKRSRELLDRVRRLLQHPWFHGKLQNSADLLASKPEGTFLVRLSNAKGSFTLVKSNGPGARPLHIRISRDANNTYGISDQRFHNLADLIEWLKDCGETILVDEDGEENLKLSEPCSHSRFETIFAGVPLELEQSTPESSEEFSESSEAEEERKKETKGRRRKTRRPGH